MADRNGIPGDLEVCIYLGLRDDSATHCTFATSSHRCYAPPVPVHVPHDQQAEYCLSDRFLDCPNYPLDDADAEPRLRSEATPALHEKALEFVRVAGSYRRPIAAGLAVITLGAIGLWSIAFFRSAMTDHSAQSVQPGGSTAAQATFLPTSAAATPAPATPNATAPSAAASAVTPTGGTPRPVPTSTPLVSTGAASPARTATPPPAPTPRTGSTTYTVVAGDNLTRLAARFGVTVDQILKANGMTDKNYIYSGQRLIIPAPAGSH